MRNAGLSGEYPDYNVQDDGHEDHDEAERAKQDSYVPEESPQEDDAHLCGFIDKGHRRQEREYPQHRAGSHTDIFRCCESSE